jgi:site-specific recombinase XerD
MLQHFFGVVGRTPDTVTSQDVFTWAYNAGLSGREPSAITIGARIACLSSFHRFLIRMKVVVSNPCDALERPKVMQSIARGLSAAHIPLKGRLQKTARVVAVSVNGCTATSASGRTCGAWRATRC